MDSIAPVDRQFRVQVAIEATPKSREVRLDEGVFAIYPREISSGYIGIVSGFAIGFDQDGAIADLDCYIGPREVGREALLPTPIPSRVSEATLLRTLEMSGDTVDVPGGQVYMDNVGEVWWCSFGKPLEAVRVGKNLALLLGRDRVLVGAAIECRGIRGG